MKTFWWLFFELRKLDFDQKSRDFRKIHQNPSKSIKIHQIHQKYTFFLTSFSACTESWCFIVGRKHVFSKNIFLVLKKYCLETRLKNIVGVQKEDSCPKSILLKSKNNHWYLGFIHLSKLSSCLGWCLLTTVWNMFMFYAFTMGIMRLITNNTWI